MPLALPARLTALAVWAACLAAPAALIAASTAQPAAAAALDLTVTVHAPGHEDMETTISLAELTAMPQTEVRAVTPWTEGVVAFEGVAFADLAARVGIAGGPVALTALNAYQITLDAGRVIADGGVLALKMNGKTMTVRDKGPIWLVFPSEDWPELAVTDNTHMWIWQIDEIAFGPR